MATPQIYTIAASSFTDKLWSWTADAFTALLLDDSYTFDPDGDVFVTDLTGELSGGSYARVNLSGKSQSAASGVVKLLCDDIVFASLTASDVKFMVVFRNTGSDATSKLFCCTEFDATIPTVTSQPITFDLGSNGLVNATVS